MNHSLIPEDEKERMNQLQKFQILDTLPENAFDELTKLTHLVCGGQICLISFIDHQRQWIKSKRGTNIEQIPRDISFCARTILQNDVFEIVDALKDESLRNHPFVTDPPTIRWYAGAPLITRGGFKIGTLCVLGDTPQRLSLLQREALVSLAKQVVNLLELREREIQLRKQTKELENLFDLSLELICIAGVDGYFKYLNPAWTIVLGYSEEELKSQPLTHFIHPDDILKTLEEIEKLKQGELTINFSVRFYAKDKTYRELNWFAYPEEKGENIFAIARDITK